MRLSIIIPIYNTKQYLKRCIDSIITQIMPGVELVLVDDGSTDGSGQICEDYIENNHNFVKVLHKQNGGQSAARNSGIEIATGDYVMFVDSDDYIQDNSLALILEVLKYKSDVYEFGFNVYLENKLSRTQLPIKTNGVMSTKDYIRKSLQSMEYEWFPWKYIFRRSFFQNKNNLFPLGIYYEDVFLIPRLLLQSDTILTLNAVIYNYSLGRPGATTCGVKLKPEIDKLNVIAENIDFFNGKEDDNLKGLLSDSFAKMFFSALIVQYVLKEKKERDCLHKKLEEKSYVTKYVRTGIQKWLAIIMKFTSLNFLSRMLYLRFRLKNGKASV